MYAKKPTEMRVILRLSKIPSCRRLPFRPLLVDLLLSMFSQGNASYSRLMTNMPGPVWLALKSAEAGHQYEADRDSGAERD